MTRCTHQSLAVLVKDIEKWGARAPYGFMKSTMDTAKHYFIRSQTIRHIRRVREELQRNPSATWDVYDPVTV